jgi:hypothetical protein
MSEINMTGKTAAAATAPVRPRFEVGAKVPGKRGVTYGEPIKRSKLQKMIEDLDGKIVGLYFVKADGESRNIAGRLKVVKYQSDPENPKPSKVETPTNSHITIFDMMICQYRNVNLETVSWVASQKKMHYVED